MKFLQKLICKHISKGHTYHKGVCACGAIDKTYKPYVMKKSDLERRQRFYVSQRKGKSGSTQDWETYVGG